MVYRVINHSVDRSYVLFQIRVSAEFPQTYGAREFRIDATLQFQMLFQCIFPLESVVKTTAIVRAHDRVGQSLITTHR